MLHNVFRLGRLGLLACALLRLGDGQELLARLGDRGQLDLARPELIELIFKRGQRRGAKTGGQFKTKVVTYGTEVNVNAFYRHSRIKQYLKDGRALRIETVINDPDDLGCRRRLQHLDELQTRARAVNTTLLDTERVGQGCVLASPAFE